MIRVLAIDGGGIRGIIPATILVALESYLKLYSHDESACLAQHFDLIAGTSTGSILTCLLLSPTKTQEVGRYSAEDILSLYLTEGKTIFSKPLLHQVRCANGMFGSKYSSRGIETLANHYFGDLKLSQLTKPCLIPAYDMQSAKSLFFNQKTGMRAPLRDFYVRDIIRGATAAPTFFKPAHIKDDHNQSYTLIDGAVFANNPAMCAYVEAGKLDARIFTEDIMLLSLGTGVKEQLYDYERIKNWGMSRWPLPLLSVFSNGSSDTIDHQLSTLFRLVEKSTNYLRIEADMNEMKLSTKMDDVSVLNIQNLHTAGEVLVSRYDEQLRRFAKRLVDETYIRSFSHKEVGYDFKW